MSSGAAVFVMGPAGSGKHHEGRKKVAHLINLDPAAEEFEYQPSKDIRDLISIDDAMDELQYGPNGGLVFCLEFLLENMDWLTSDLGEYQDEFLIIDCPGQIELYTHSDIMSRIVDAFRQADYKVCVLYLLESLFLQDVTRYFAGILTATSAMLRLGAPHVNVLTKMDLLEGLTLGNDGDNDDPANVVGEDSDYEDDLHPLHRFLFPDPSLLEEKLRDTTRPKFYQLNKALVNLVDEYDMVSFTPVNIKKEQSLEKLMLQIDFATQYSESLEPHEPQDRLDSTEY